MAHATAVTDVQLEMGIPFAFVSGYDGPFEARHADVPLLRKPFTADQLRVLLEKLVGAKWVARREGRRGLTHPPEGCPLQSKIETAE